MGGKAKTTKTVDKTTKTNTTQDVTQTPTASAAEQQLNVQAQDRLNTQNPLQQQLFSNTGNLINQLLTGQGLPGFLSGLPGGISPELTSELSQQAVRDITPQFQQSGILDSGVAASIAGRTAGDIRRRSAEFNINNLINLLQTGLGGQSSLASQGISQEANLGGRLAGLRSFRTQGEGTGVTSIQGTTTTLAPNPFVTSLQQSLGELPSKIIQGAASGALGCWVAAEIFGGWYEPKTCAARHYINNIAPKWFKDFYIKHGESIAKFISNKPILKLFLKPMFELFAIRGKLSFV